MFKFIGQILFIGLFFGIVATSITMVFGLAVYYAIDALEIFLSAYFLTYAAWIALAVGLLCTFAWYSYILILARKYFLKIMDQFVDSLKGEKK